MCLRDHFVETAVTWQRCNGGWSSVIDHLPEEMAPFDLSRGRDKKTTRRLCKQMIQNTGLINLPL